MVKCLQHETPHRESDRVLSVGYEKDRKKIKRLEASNKLQVPLWLVIGLGALVLIVLAVLATLVVTNSQPSDTDLAVRARMGDKEAGAKLEEKYAPPTPKPVKDATFTPGVYTEAESVSACQGDAAKAVACFQLSIAHGDVQKAVALLSNPNDPNAIASVNENSTSWSQDLANGTISPLNGISVSTLYKRNGGANDLVKKGPFSPGEYFVFYELQTEAGEFGGIEISETLRLNSKGEWGIIP